MTHRARFLDELQRAMVRGFTLAAVSASLACNRPSPVSTDSRPMIAPPTSAPPKSRLRDLDGGLLAQVPSGSLGCSGEAEPGFHGRCCTQVHCYAPTSETCVEASALSSSVAPGITPRLPIGSGTCRCGQTQGPFAQPDGGVTECCYVVGTMGCSGRPLRDRGDSVVASVVVRSDWA